MIKKNFVGQICNFNIAGQTVYFREQYLNG